MPTLFTVTEIKNQAKDIREKSENYRYYTSDMISSLDYILPRVASEDSNLADKIRQIADTYRSLNSSIAEKFQDLALIMETYCQKTESNEEVASSSIKSITEANLSLSDKINALMAKWSL